MTDTLLFFGPGRRTPRTFLEWCWWVLRGRPDHEEIYERGIQNRAVARDMHEVVVRHNKNRPQVTSDGKRLMWL